MPWSHDRKSYVLVAAVISPHPGGKTVSEASAEAGPGEGGGSTLRCVAALRAGEPSSLPALYIRKTALKAVSIRKFPFFSYPERLTIGYNP